MLFTARLVGRVLLVPCTGRRRPVPKARRSRSPKSSCRQWGPCRRACSRRHIGERWNARALVVSRDAQSTRRCFVSDQSSASHEPVRPTRQRWLVTDPSSIVSGSNATSVLRSASRSLLAGDASGRPAASGPPWTAASETTNGTGLKAAVAERVAMGRCAVVRQRLRGPLVHATAERPRRVPRTTVLSQAHGGIVSSIGLRPVGRPVAPIRAGSIRTLPVRGTNPRRNGSLERTVQSVEHVIASQHPSEPMLSRPRRMSLPRISRRTDSRRTGRSVRAVRYRATVRGVVAYLPGGAVEVRVASRGTHPADARVGRGTDRARR